MGFFSKKKKIGLKKDVIRCDESEHLIWKWHPDGTVEGEHKREYAIRNGSVLRVRDGEVAVFVHKRKGGALYDYVEGPFEQTLKTENLPVLGAFIDASWGGASPFPAEVYFINVARNVQLKFGVPYFDVFDTEISALAVPVAVRGTLIFKIDNCDLFVKTHRLESLTITDFGNKIKDAVVRCVKNVITNVPLGHGIPILQMERRITRINDIIMSNVKERLESDFGVAVVNMDINAIEPDKLSEGYKTLIRLNRDSAVAVAETKAAAEIELAKIDEEAEARRRRTASDIEDDEARAASADKIKASKEKTDADAEDYRETKRIDRDVDELSRRKSIEDHSYDRRMKTKTENIKAYEIGERARVEIVTAEAKVRVAEAKASGAETDKSFSDEMDGFVLSTEGVKCSVCGASLDKDASFCSSCGEKMKSACFCTACGAKLVEDAEYCVKCGKKVT